MGISIYFSGMISKIYFQVKNEKERKMCILCYNLSMKSGEVYPPSHMQYLFILKCKYHNGIIIQELLKEFTHEKVWRMQG